MSHHFKSTGNLVCIESVSGMTRVSKLQKYGTSRLQNRKQTVREVAGKVAAGEQEREKM